MHGRLPVVLVASFVAIGAACNGGGGSTPTSPTPPTTTPPVATTASLSGTISSSTGGGVAGATVTITDGANGGRSTTTSTTGTYRFDGLTPSNGNVIATADGWEDNGNGLFITGNATLSMTLRAIPYSRAGSGNTVFDVPRRTTRIAVFARWNGNSTSNFILRHVGGFSIVNEILRNNNPYNGTHQTNGGRLEIIDSGNISEWRITEMP